MSNAYTTSQIISAIDRLSIYRESEPNHKRWLQIECPNLGHFEKVHDNCFINIDSGICKCWSCGYTKHIVNVVMERMGYSYKEACSFIEEGIGSSSFYIAKFEDVKKEKPKRKLVIDDFTCIDFDPNNYYYTRQRGFTKEFCNTFGIKHCLSDRYEDYFLIPIIDSKKEINEFEARKLIEHENILKYFKVESLEDSRKYLRDHCLNNNIIYNKGKLLQDGKPLIDLSLKYLLRRKTLYSPDSRVQQTIWNIDNLDFNQTLYVVEGIGSIPKIWTYISKNATCLFGTSITEDQLEYLKKFKEVIYIPDPDIAGYKSVKLLNMELNNVKIIDIQEEDTDDNYVEAIRNAMLLSCRRYLVSHLKRYMEQ